MSNVIPNQIITLADIKSNPELWNQKFSIIEFTDQNKKPYWTKQYNFLPHWKRYKEARDWIKNTNFPEYNCKIVWNANNEIELITQNYFGETIAYEQKETELLGKIRKKLHQQINELEKGDETRKDLEELLKLKTYEEFNSSPYSYLFYQQELTELKQVSIKKSKSNNQKQAYDLARSDLAILWKKKLYFISSFTYINNYKLSVQISAKACLLYINYGQWLTSQGHGTVEKGPLLKITSDKFEDNQRMHYDFCGDLGIKKIEEQAFLSYQPKFHLFRIRPTTDSGGRYMGWSEQQGEKVGLKIPYNVGLEPFDERKQEEERSFWEKNQLVLKGLMAIGAITGAEGPIRKAIQSLLKTNINLMIGPAEMVNYGKSYWSKFEEKEEVLFPKSPTFTKWLKEQPHVWDHTTFQFYLFNKITMSANGRFLGIKEKDGKFVLPYKLFINCAPGALYYRWQFGFIYVKLEISTQGSFQDYTNPMRFMQGFNFKIEGGFLGTGGGFGMGMNWNSNNADQAGKSEVKEDPSPEQEANTDRTFKSTFRDFVGKSVEPAMFNANTIDFNYSLGEFFNRLTDPIWFYRVEISELLYNKLGWCNNKSPLLNLPLSWKEIGTWTQKPGYWKWSNVSLQKDTNNFFTNIMNKGYRLDDGKELTNPKLAFAHIDSHIQVGGNAWNVTQAEEEVTETKENVKETLINSDITNADYGNADYIGSRDANIWEELNRVNNNVHTATMGAGGNNCLGCLCGGGSHNNPNYNFEKTYNFTSGGSLELKTRGSGLQTCQIPNQGGKVIFEAKGNLATITLEYEKINRTVKVKKDPNPVKQEIDKEALENEVENEIEESFEEENEEEMNDLAGDKEKEAEPEQEGETEQEKEDEQEQEEETEQEKEQENEKEQEGEKEGEKEEEEEESESENENEGEDEGEN